MKRIPEAEEALVIRTDFRDDAAWEAVKRAIVRPVGEFRVVPSERWGVENNLSLGNMDFDEFASLVDADGIFWGLGVEDGWGMMDKDWMTKGVLFLGLEVGERVRIRAYKANGTCYQMIPSQ